MNAYLKMLGDFILTILTIFDPINQIFTGHLGVFRECSFKITQDELLCWPVISVIQNVIIRRRRLNHRAAENTPRLPPYSCRNGVYQRRINSTLGAENISNLIHSKDAQRESENRSFLYVLHLLSSPDCVDAAAFRGCVCTDVASAVCLSHWF